MPYTNKNSISTTVTKADILAAIATYQPADLARAQQAKTKEDLIRIARHQTLENAYRQKTIRKMMA